MHSHSVSLVLRPLNTLLHYRSHSHIHTLVFEATIQGVTTHTHTLMNSHQEQFRVQFLPVDALTCDLEELGIEQLIF